MKCIALQYSVTDSSTLKAYDQTISIYDTAEQIKEKLLQLHGSEAGGKEHDALSAREREIVVCVVKGMTNKQIAESCAYRCIRSSRTAATSRASSRSTARPDLRSMP